MNNYLVYCAKFENGKSYIGLTNNLLTRKYQHTWQANNNSALAFHKALRKYNHAATWTIIASDLTLEEAKNFEIEFIKSIGTYIKNGMGYNLTIGGEGSSGFIKSEEQISNWKASTKETFESNDYREKLSNSIKKSHKRPEVVAKISKSQKHRFSDATQRKSMSEKVTLSLSTTEAKVNMSNGQKKRFSDTGEVKKISDSRKEFIKNNYAEFLKSVKAKPIFVFLNEELIGEFPSSTSCAQALQLKCPSGIRACLTGKRKTYKNYTFKYKEQL